MEEKVKIEISRVLDKMRIIQNETPIIMEYETDAREVWPSRWENLRAWLHETSWKIEGKFERR